MRNALRSLRLATNTILRLLMNPSCRNIEAIIRVLSVKINPFSSKRKRPLISRYIRYTKEILKGEVFDIGDYTYGTPRVFPHPGRKLKIGKFCSIAAGVTIALGGNHRSDLITTYPFKAFVVDWPESECLSWEDVAAVSKGDVIIGNDVWIGYGANVLSGVKIGDGAVIGVVSQVNLPPILKLMFHPVSQVNMPPPDAL